MKSKIFQQILDETPEDIKISMREYADFMIEKNQLSHQKGLETKIIVAPLSNNLTTLPVFEKTSNKVVYNSFVLIVPIKQDITVKWLPIFVKN